MRNGTFCSPTSVPGGAIISKMLACLTWAKLLKISAVLLTAVCAAIAELKMGMAPVSRRCAGYRNRKECCSKRKSATSSDCTWKISARARQTASGVGEFLSADANGNRKTDMPISSLAGILEVISIRLRAEFGGGVLTVSPFFRPISYSEGNSGTLNRTDRLLRSRGRSERHLARQFGTGESDDRKSDIPAASESRTGA